MFSYLIWKWEIADVMYSIAKLIEHFSEAKRIGGFDGAAASLRRLGRNYKDMNSSESQRAKAVMACPKYEFDICIDQPTDNDRCTIHFWGGPRYAGFSFTCGLPPQTFIAEARPTALMDVSWRAKKLVAAIQADQLAAARR
jgi:hypothetical protein